MKFMRPESLSPKAEIPAISAPPFQLHCPSMTRSPLLDHIAPKTPKTPKSPLASRLMSTPIASPMKKAITSMQCYLKEVGHFTKLDPQEAWLPITESRNGDAYYSAFHTLGSGTGVQALVLPFAFTTLSCTTGQHAADDIPTPFEVVGFVNQSNTSKAIHPSNDMLVDFVS
ncbi:unnamed protein product [Dovyalis caffra]|uniref:Uncharacterized protein n=1 Tax=Dovyalis caffra TaxID=77055 RepID=A0AAV1S573_9ROSI|nr:unnamed protein product [Dovyalis caffra]